jgi:hypothetical protein
LRVAPALRLLATSREPLGVPGEAFVTVGSLPEGDAVALLAARIRAARGHAPDAGETEAVARIAGAGRSAAGTRARRGEGTGAVDRRDRGRPRGSIRALDRGPRTAEPRHQTCGLSSTGAGACSTTRSDALLALAVFPDGISSADLAEVTAAFGLPETAIDDLVERSLVQRSRGRYRLLETVREYGLDALHRSGRLEDARGRQAAVMAQLALAQDRALRTAAGPAIAWFDANEENLAAATRFSVGHGELEVRLARAQLWIWQLRERFDLLTSVLNATATPADALASEADVVVAAMAMLMRTMLDPTTTHLSTQSVARIAAAAQRYDSELAAVLPVVLRGALRARQDRRGDEPWSTYLRLDERSDGRPRLGPGVRCGHERGHRAEQR